MEIFRLAAPLGWVAAVGATCLRVWAADPVPIGVSRSQPAVANISFRGTSTLHDFEGHVVSQPFTLVLSSNSWSAKADVLGGEMSTVHEKRDRNMWKMFSISDYPRLSGTITNVAFSATNATLGLRIRDQKLNVPVTISKWSTTTNGIRFHAAWDVSLAQFGLKPPSVLGVIRVGDKVRVEADVATAQPASNTPAISQ